MNIQQILEQENISKEKIQYNVPMSKYTSFKVGGPAECLIKIETLEELKQILEIAQNNNIKTTIIGNGSNILVKDEGIKGIVLKIEIKKFELSKENELIVGSGNKLGEIAQKLAKEEITGFEFASGIPGCLGGGVTMNAGAYDGEMKDIIQSVTVIDKDGKIREISNEDMHFAYRMSDVQKYGYIVIKAKLKLKKGKKSEIQATVDDLTERRTSKQPLEYPSCGSVFKRPVGHFAGGLITDSGLKGFSIGGAQVSEKHAGFIINKGGATAEDVLALVKHIQDTVKKDSGVDLVCEIRIV